ncbi:Oidioi.mRNA.OKI2018_I69.chr1.g1970.t1.cds [Oikopleura dioica]|uniref:Oidioi.mRNA.OKI2018_I69.chr1.g1970.t1.cds n=1 Tax=Oikopleura dioica TaxID=34765 RepID=A0ABN7SRA5_OIKDI|nr:Oidioi.mRNA.OKI2018_I69.chr1.g1970.t1.cds [Oikopleura dioica]
MREMNPNENVPQKYCSCDNLFKSQGGCVFCNLNLLVDSRGPSTFLQHLTFFVDYVTTAMIEEFLRHIEYRKIMFALLESYIIFGTQVGYREEPGEEAKFILQGAFSQFFGLFGDVHFEMLDAFTKETISKIEKHTIPMQEGVVFLATVFTNIKEEHYPLERYSGLLHHLREDIEDVVMTSPFFTFRPGFMKALHLLKMPVNLKDGFASAVLKQILTTDDIGDQDLSWMCMIIHNIPPGEIDQKFFKQSIPAILNRLRAKASSGEFSVLRVCVLKFPGMLDDFLQMDFMDIVGDYLFSFKENPNCMEISTFKKKCLSSTNTTITALSPLCITSSDSFRMKMETWKRAIFAALRRKVGPYFYR